MKTTLALASITASLIACASANPAATKPADAPHDPPASATSAATTPAPTSTAEAGHEQPTTATSTSATGSKCTIGGTAFNAAFARREDDEDDDVVLVTIFATAPATAAEKKSACDRANPIPAFAMKSDKRAVEVEFKDPKNLTTKAEATFLTHTEGTSFMHDLASSTAAELKGSGAEQTIHMKAKSDDADCELTVRVVTCAK